MLVGTACFFLEGTLEGAEGPGVLREEGIQSGVKREGEGRNVKVREEESREEGKWKWERSECKVSYIQGQDGI